MPGTNLTRDEAATRAALLDVTSYSIDLDLTTGEKTFGSTTTIRFTCSEPGSSTFADLVDATVHEITLNGEQVDPATAYADSRIALSGLAAENELVVRADCTYSRTGEGLHRFVDPADDRVYLYSQFEVPDARRVYTTFEQPDLKAPFTFRVTAPSHWKVVSNAATPAPRDTGDGKAVWEFPETKPMSTYITAIVAGEYHEVLDTYEGKHGDIPLGHYCRQSLVEHMDVEELVKLTRQGFEFFEELFDFPYPFGKYDQLYVPEYNMGAMENAGCVTLRDEYLPRSRQDRSFYEFRAEVILHEMAHMWFGDLVTMKWWDDLWLNESFAEWACYHAAVEATEFTESWVASPTPARTGPTARTSCPAPTRSRPTTSTCVRSRSTSTASPTPRAPRCSSSWWPGSGSTTSSRASAATSRTSRSRTPSSRTCWPPSRRPPAASSSRGRRSGCRPRA